MNKEQILEALKGMVLVVRDEGDKLKTDEAFAKACRRALKRECRISSPDKSGLKQGISKAQRL